MSGEGAVSTGQAEDEVRGAGKAINSSVCILPPCIVARGGEGNKSQQDVCCGVARGGTWVPMLCKWHRSLPMRDDAFTWKTATTQHNRLGRTSKRLLAIFRTITALLIIVILWGVPGFVRPVAGDTSQQCAPLSHLLSNT